MWLVKGKKESEGRREAAKGMEWNAILGVCPDSGRQAALDTVVGLCFPPMATCGCMRAEIKGVN